MFDFLKDFKVIVVSLVLGLLVGFTAGTVTEGRFEKAKQVAAATQAQHQTASGLASSLKTSGLIDAKVAATSQFVDIAKDLVAKRIATTQAAQPPVQTVVRTVYVNQPQPKETPNDTSVALACPAGGWNLDVGTVRLLNAARAGTAGDATGLSDAESKAPSTVGPIQFADNDLEVVKEYHDLATRHDALVDYVQTLINKQAKNP